MAATRSPARPLLLTARAAVLDLVAEAVLPTACPCGIQGRVLCRDCTRMLLRPVRRVDDRLDALQLIADSAHGIADGGSASYQPRFPVLALGDYSGVMQDAVLAFKNGGHWALADAFAPLLAEGLSELPHCSRAAVLVPVPSSAAAVRPRGEHHTLLLAQRIARLGGTEAADCLRTGAGGQRLKNARDRRRHQRMRVTARAHLNGRVPLRAVLVDDVATTGASLAAAADALQRAGSEVLGALTIAAARPVSAAANTWRDLQEGRL